MLYLDKCKSTKVSFRSRISTEILPCTAGIFDGCYVLGSQGKLWARATAFQKSVHGSALGSYNYLDEMVCDVRSGISAGREEMFAPSRSVVDILTKKANEIMNVKDTYFRHNSMHEHIDNGLSSALEQAFLLWYKEQFKQGNIPRKWAPMDIGLSTPAGELFSTECNFERLVPIDRGEGARTGYFDVRIEGDDRPLHHLLVSYDATNTSSITHLWSPYGVRNVFAKAEPYAPYDGVPDGTEGNKFTLCPAPLFALQWIEKEHSYRILFFPIQCISWRGPVIIGMARSVEAANRKVLEFVGLCSFRTVSYTGDTDEFWQVSNANEAKLFVYSPMHPDAFHARIDKGIEAIANRVISECELDTEYRRDWYQSMVQEVKDHLCDDKEPDEIWA